VSQVYLVEGYWSDYDSEDHWFPAAFLDRDAADQYRQECQAWIDNYVREFWEEYVRRFGEPREREHHCVWTPETIEDVKNEHYENPGYALAHEWFGYDHLFDDQGGILPNPADVGRTRMRRLSPDPLIDTDFVAGSVCHYRVVTVPLKG
jgi:hypothetical protein